MQGEYFQFSCARHPSSSDELISTGTGILCLISERSEFVSLHFNHYGPWKALQETKSVDVKFCGDEESDTTRSTSDPTSHKQWGLKNSLTPWSTCLTMISGFCYTIIIYMVSNRLFCNKNIVVSAHLAVGLVTGRGPSLRSTFVDNVESFWEEWNEQVDIMVVELQLRRCWRM